MKRTQVYIDDARKVKARQLAITLDCTLSELVRVGIDLVDSHQQYGVAHCSLADLLRKMRKERESA